MNENSSPPYRKQGMLARVPWGLIFGVAGVAFGIALWTMGAVQPSPEEDPNWIPLVEMQALEAELAQAEQKHQTLQQAYQQSQDRLRMVQASQTKLAAEIKQSLALDQLPTDLRASNPQLAVLKIQRLWEDQQTFSPQTVDALLQLLVQIIDTGIINTTRPADDTRTQDLYCAVQVVLRSINIYQGEVTGDQKATSEALTAFQRSSKLKVDGKMGMKTFGALAEQFKINIATQNPS